MHDIRKVFYSQLQITQCRDVVAAPKAASTGQDTDAAFNRADSNKDGQRSRPEARATGLSAGAAQSSAIPVRANGGLEWPPLLNLARKS